MLSIAVCDDAVLDCCKLAGEIRGILEDMGEPYLLRQFYDGKELLNAVESFDIIFLDILMRGVDGMRTAHLMRERAFEKMIVFVSSSREYVMDAFDVEAFYYLTKPVDAGKLRNILKRAAKKLENDPEEFILIERDRRNRKLLLRQIWYFEIRGRVISVHSGDGVFDYYGQIGELERSLGDKGFFRCHKSFLINLRYVRTYDREEVTLDNGERIMIARRRYSAFCQAILAYMRRDGGTL